MFYNHVFTLISFVIGGAYTSSSTFYYEFVLECSLYPVPVYSILGSNVLLGTRGAGAVRRVGRGRLRVDSGAVDEDEEDRLGPRGVRARHPILSVPHFLHDFEHVIYCDVDWACERVPCISWLLDLMHMTRSRCFLTFCCVTRRATRRRAWRSLTWPRVRSVRGSRARPAWPTPASISTRLGVFSASVSFTLRRTH